MENKLLISINAAILAKKLDFDELVLYYYDGSDMIASQAENVFDYKNYNTHHGSTLKSAPSLLQLQKWLREKYNIHVSPVYKPNIRKWDYVVYDLMLNGKEYIKHCYSYNKKYPNRRFDSYEEAIKYGLEEALLSIKNKIK